MKEPICLLVACGSKQIRARVKQMLHDYSWAKNISEADDPADILQMIRNKHIDTAILISGSREQQPTAFEIAHIIKLEEMDIKTIILSENIARDIAPAVTSNVSALVQLSANKDELITAILSSQNGNNADAGFDNAS